MRVYVACALTHATEEFRASVEQFKNSLRQNYEVLDFLGLVTGDAKEVFRHDLDGVKNCDLLIAECSYPATGVGFEIATALYLNKPVLVVAHKDAKVSRLILGIDNPLFTFRRYADISEVLELIAEYQL